jgi:hypothetical protein
MCAARTATTAPIHSPAKLERAEAMNCGPSILRALLVKKAHGKPQSHYTDARRQHVELRRGGAYLNQQHEYSSIVEGAARHSSSEKTLHDSSNSVLNYRV